jgi:hypothetical protein
MYKRIVLAHMDRPNASQLAPFQSQYKLLSVLPAKVAGYAVVSVSGVLSEPDQRAPY